jgi:hypothetical protein
MFIAVGAATTLNDGAGYSYDGNNWTAITSSISIMNVPYGITYGDKWIMAGGNPYNIIYSNDGITWSGSTNASGLTNGTFCSVWNGSIWLAGASGSNRIIKSYDGITWSGTTNGNSIFNNGVLNIAWNGTMFVACGGNDTIRLAYSYDGDNWSGSTNGNSLFTATFDVAWNGSMWIVGGAGTNRIAYSTDGITWSGTTNGDTIFNSSINGVASKPAPNLYPPR